MNSKQSSIQNVLAGWDWDGSVTFSVPAAAVAGTFFLQEDNEEEEEDEDEERTFNAL